MFVGEKKDHEAHLQMENNKFRTKTTKNNITLCELVSKSKQRFVTFDN